MLNLYSNSKSKFRLRKWYAHGINTLPTTVANYEFDVMKKNFRMAIIIFEKSQFGEKYQPLKCTNKNCHLSIARSCQLEVHRINLPVDKFCMTSQLKKIPLAKNDLDL